MPLSPQDIVRKEFRESFRGYNQADVDLFLDEVVEEFTRLYEENQKMKVRLAALQQEVARLRGGTPAPTQATPLPPAPAQQPDPMRVEAEVRTRMKRFLEDQLRAIDEGSPLSATAQRIARELPSQQQQQKKQEPPPPPPQPPSQEPQSPPPAKSGGEPFWAGE
ncbi:MAG: DivIVA domain-containing protein [Actinomycetota bacterium]|nr:DivIVA domain-containing protein [Actinomycetota bacterium]